LKKVPRLGRLTGRCAAPERLVTERLVLRRPVAADLRPIFERYASDPEVTRYLAWPRHTTLDDTRVFLDFSEAEWRRWGCGPYLVHTGRDERLIGSAGLSLESDELASTGYVFARDAWGHGYASETLRAMTTLACSLGVRWLYGLCHVDHRASARVMEKCGFSPEGVLRQHIAFPNISPLRADVLRYGITFNAMEAGRRV
jgi:RimJ/RimL family protein N-acetyltransferase